MCNANVVLFSGILFVVSVVGFCTIACHQALMKSNVQYELYSLRTPEPLVAYASVEKHLELCDEYGDG